MTGRLLIGGIGNVFLGDDAFGVEVAQRLQSRPLPDGTVVVDFGIRGIDLAYALSDFPAAILIDTVARGGDPGTLYVLEPEAFGTLAHVEGHSMTPDRVLSWVGADAPARLRLVGCEPATFGEEGVGREGLSPLVQQAVDEAVLLVERLAAELVEEDDLDA